MNPLIFLYVEALCALVVILTKRARTEKLFKFKEVAKNDWRIYFYGLPISMDHVRSDSHGFYICWDSKICSESDAKIIATRWLDSYT